MECSHFYRNAECNNAECRYVECQYADCRYAECPYAECHGAMELRRSNECRVYSNVAL